MVKRLVNFKRTFWHVQIIFWLVLKFRYFEKGTNLKKIFHI
jgi:hypothetical protein